MKKIRVGLSVSEFKKAAEEVERYRKSLIKKCAQFTRELAELGLETSRAILRENVDTGETIGSLHIEDDSHGNIMNMKIVVQSDAILFLEFGSGIKYSGTKNPKASEMGYGPGTYPGKGHWDDPDGWWYPDDNGGYSHTYGIEATMPMYNASVQMRDNITKLAKKVFSS